MGTYYYIGCRNCRVYRDIWKAYYTDVLIEDYEYAQAAAKELAGRRPDLESAVILIDFLRRHSTDGCSCELFNEHQVAHDWFSSFAAMEQVVEDEILLRNKEKQAIEAPTKENEAIKTHQERIEGLEHEIRVTNKRLGQLEKFVEHAANMHHGSIAVEAPVNIDRALLDQTRERLTELRIENTAIKKDMSILRHRLHEAEKKLWPELFKNDEDEE